MTASKYGNKRVDLDGYTFDSKREAARYQELCLMQKAGLISALDVHPQYPLVVGGMKIGKYTGDFSYQENGKLVLEDVKSAPTKTEAYGLRKRLVRALYGIVVQEVE